MTRGKNSAPGGAAWRLLAALLLAGLAPLADAGARDRGQRNRSGPSSQVVGGHPVADGAFPFMVHLRIDVGKDTFACGGSLIAPGAVLTAAHCAVDDRGQALPPAAFRATIGSTVLGEAEAINRYDVTAVSVYDGYDPETSSGDVAVLTLNRPVDHPEVEPIALIAANGPEDDKRRKATVAGWGRTKFKAASSPDRMRAASLEVTGLRSCRKVYKSGLLADTMLCAYAKKRDTCQGDSGGPIFVATTSGPVQIGITSFGIGCGFRGIPGVYTRLSNPGIGAFVRSFAGPP